MRYDEKEMPFFLYEPFHFEDILANFDIGKQTYFCYEIEPERPKYSPPSRAQSKRKAPAPPAIKREVGILLVFLFHCNQTWITKICRDPAGRYAIEQRQRELEERGVELETKLRQDTDDDAAHDDNLLSEWFDVVNKKNKLVRREGELIAQAQQQELELQHAEIEYELRVILQKQEHERIDADAQREEQLLELLMEVVQKRNQIVERLEEDRLREEAEDRDIEAMLGTGSDKKKDKKHKKKHKLGLIK
nr:MICAL-like protein 1 [Lytechinus pictus]